MCNFNTNIYVVAHKFVDIAKYNLDFCYKLIRVGKYAKTENTYGISDATGYSITEKNANYCELTALYWIWKNDNESDVKGLCHYRRYFVKSKISPQNKYILSAKDIDSIMAKHDAIVSTNEIFSCGAYGEYLRCGHIEDLILTKEAISTLFPDYLNIYENEFERGYGLHGFNMIIAKREIFDDYCEWLFKILGYVEERLDISSYTKQEARVYGYLSERLLSVWLKYNKINYKECRVINTEDKHDLKFYIRELLKILGLFNLIKRISYELNNSSKD